MYVSRCLPFEAALAHFWFDLVIGHCDIWEVPAMNAGAIQVNSSWVMYKIIVFPHCRIYTIQNCKFYETKNFNEPKIVKIDCCKQYLIFHPARMALKPPLMPHGIERHTPQCLLISSILHTIPLFPYHTLFNEYTNNSVMFFALWEFLFSFVLFFYFFREEWWKKEKALNKFNLHFLPAVSQEYCWLSWIHAIALWTAKWHIPLFLGTFNSWCKPKIALFCRFS